MAGMTMAKPPMRTFGSFLFNVKKLGVCWWCRTAAKNAWASLTGRDP